MPRLSIVIPCLGGAAEFDSTLVSVLQNRPADCEVLVAHTETYDDPYELGGEVHFVRSPAQSLVELINAAVTQATGEIVHILACGMEVSEGWTAAALPHFGDEEIAAVSPIVLDAEDRKIVAAGVRWTLGGVRVVVTDERILNAGAGRLRRQVLGPTLAAGFYRRTLLAALGGFEVALGDGLADVGLALDMEALGQMHLCEPACQVVRRAGGAQQSAGEFNRARTAQRLFWRHAARRGVGSSLLMHGAALAYGALKSAGRPGALQAALGRLLGTCEIGAGRRYRERLDLARTCLAELATLAAAPVSRRKSRPVAPTTSATSYRRAA